MNTEEWIKQLIEVESVITWEGFELSRTLTPDEQSRAKEIVASGSGGAFDYWPSKHGYRGELIQRKMLPWNILYSILVQLPFCQCEQILLPLNVDVLEFIKRRNPERIEKLLANGYISARPFVRKSDQFIVVSIYLYSHFENYDEDGYGGGEDDYYIVGIIDPQGRWALPPQECVDFRLGFIKDSDPSCFIAEDMRKPIFDVSGQSYS